MVALSVLRRLRNLPFRSREFLPPCLGCCSQGKSAVIACSIMSRSSGSSIRHRSPQKPTTRGIRSSLSFSLGSSIWGAFSCPPSFSPVPESPYHSLLGICIEESQRRVAIYPTMPRRSGRKLTANCKDSIYIEGDSCLSDAVPSTAECTRITSNN